MKPVKFICLIIFLSLLGACGGDTIGGPGTPGSSGTNKTNVNMYATVTPIFTNTPTVSANCPGVEKAEVSITAKRLFEEIQAGVQTIEKYEIKYFIVTPGAPPIEEYDTGFQTINIDCSGDKCDGGLTLDPFDAVLVNEQRKGKYISDVQSGVYKVEPEDHTEYVAKYTFLGKDQWGSEISFPAQTTFTIGKGTCPE